MNRVARECTARVEKVANGATINGTYRQSPEDALGSFRADLRVLVALARKAAK